MKMSVRARIRVRVRVRVKVRVRKHDMPVKRGEGRWGRKAVC